MPHSQWAVVAAMLLLAGQSALAKPDSYSPTAGSSLPMQVLWGDTHLHTSYSADAFTMGNVALTPEQAYAFARGDEVTASNGMTARLNRPLDFLVVADHAEYLGLLAALRNQNRLIQEFDLGREWAEKMNAGGNAALEVMTEIGHLFTSANPIADSGKHLDKVRFSAWETTNQHAEAANTPGAFTAFAGFEWTSMPGGDNLHRVVMFRDGAERLTQVAPFSAVDSQDPEALWDYLAKYEITTGGRALAIPHNGNVSNGRMFTPTTFKGADIDRDYAERRVRWEPIVEVTQIKGDGEAHPLLSPNDEFADYGTWDTGNIFGNADKEPWMLKYEYARSALKLGMEIEQTTGVNPYRFGMIGSTDAHNGLAASEEDNFWGKSASHEPAPERTRGPFVDDVPVSPKVDKWQQVASGYAAVWATENTREAIFDAMQRREVYATTGPRMTVRFYGGWDYEEADATRPDYARIGYAKGVPMGSELPAAPRFGTAPRFLIAVMKDASGANLDRVQVIKGWLDAEGVAQEKVYGVIAASAAGRRDGAGGLKPLLPAVNLPEATYQNTIGAVQLATVWTDPEFDPDRSAFYYLRVLEIPTPRWVVYDRQRLDAKLDPKAELIHQERAYTSPIWYRPNN